MTSLPITRPAPELPAGPRAALVVATGNYTDPVLTRLEATARDAAEMADVLANPDIGSFEVTSVVDQTAQEIRLAVEDFLDGRGRADLIVVYLSCHGLLDRQDRLYFAATDTRRDRLAATGVEGQWLWDRLEECRATCQVVILDCCNSGAFGRAGAKGDAVADLRLPERFVAQGRGRVVLTASRANQRSWESDPAGGTTAPSVFTSALVEGLRTGAADADGDGYVSVDDAYVYAYRKVIESGAGQVPQRSMSTGEGTMLLARNPVGLVITPAPLPEDLRAALDSPQPAIRVGAVNALGGWLTGPDPARALTADQTLRHIVTTEVLAVATVARGYLRASDVLEPAGRPAADPAAPDVAEPAARPVTDPAAPDVAEPAARPVTDPAAPDVAEPAARPVTDPAAPDVAEPAAPAGAAASFVPAASGYGAARLLAAGFIILALISSFTAYYILSRTIQIWPWWVIAGLCAPGLASALGGLSRNAILGTVLLLNLAWFLIYSLSVVGVQHSTPSTIVNTLASECYIGASVNVILCLWVAILFFRGNRRADPFLAILTGGFAIALILAAVTIGTGQQPTWNAAGIVTIANALVCVGVSARVLRARSAVISADEVAAAPIAQPGA